MSSILPAPQTAQLDSLTSLRFFAAAMVVVSHLAFLQSSQNPLVRGLYEGVFREGYMGVTFFFILSGFILSHSYAERLRQGMTYRQFLVTRLARIYPLHLLTLFIAFPIALASLVSGKRSLSIFLEGLIANLALLQAFSPVVDIHFSMNAPSWSISNEMFFYAMFPILVSSRSAYLFGSAVAILLTQQVIGNFADENTAHFLVYVFPPSRIADFVIGILLHRFFSRTRPPAASLATGLQVGSLTIFALCVTLKALIPQHARYDLYYIPAMSLIIISFAWQDGMIAKTLASDKFVFLGNASFSLYLMHQLIIRYGEHIRVNVLKATGTSIEVMVSITYFALSLLLSAILFKYFENWAKRLVLEWLNPWVSRAVRHV